MYNQPLYESVGKPFKKLNIGLFTDTFTPDINGVSISVATLRQQLIAMGHNVYVITPTLDTKLLWTTFEKDGILRIPSIKLKKLYGYRISRPFSIRALEFIKSMNLDIIHVHTEFGIRILSEWISSIFAIPFIYTYHTMYEDYTHYVTHGHFTNVSKKLVTWYSKVLVNKANEIIVPSVKTSDALHAYGVEKEIHLIPTGIDIKRFNRDNVDKNVVGELKTKYNLNGKFVMTYIGRFAPEKSVDLVINALPELIKKIPDLLFLVVGYGPSFEDLNNLVTKLNISEHVIFTGKQPANLIQNFYALGDVFVSASTSETQGITYIEAMANGLPVIARYDECLEGVLIEEKTGYFFTNPQEFIEKMVKFYKSSDEHKSNMNKNVLEKATEYSLETFGNKIIAVYNKAIDERDISQITKNRKNNAKPVKKLVKTVEKKKYEFTNEVRDLIKKIK